MSAELPSEVELLRIEVTTLTDLLQVHEEQAARQFELIRRQQVSIEDRARRLDDANRELAATASFLRELYRVTPGVLVVFDAAGVIESTNDDAMRLLGYREAELVGRPFATLFDGDAVGFADLDLLARDGKVFRGERTLIDRCGRRISVEVSAALCSASVGGPRRAVCVAFDLTKRKALELELRQAQKLESVGRLASGVAHEINTPVQFVTDSLHFVRDAMTDLGRVITALSAVPGAAVAAAEEIESADLPYLLEQVPLALARSFDGLSRVATIVRSMKDFAHPDSTDMAAVDLNRAVESTLVIARNEYKYVAELDTHFEALPPVTCHVGDINQAVLNIVVNAAHAIGDVVAGTGDKGRITVTTHHEDDQVTIRITDTGGGIPDGIRERIFEPFFTTKAVGRGTGQGLAIARAVIRDKHGGDLQFTSQGGVGTTFVIRLPVTPEPNKRGGDRV